MKKWVLIFFGLLFLGVNNLKAESHFLDVRVEVVAKGASKLLNQNQFDSVESLISGAAKLNRVKAGMQGFVKGDGASIFKAISHGIVRSRTGRDNVIYNMHRTNALRYLRYR